jgi:gas vesicle protein
MDAGKFFVGFLFGAASGAMAALMTAPQSGEATQTAIRQRAKLVMDEGKRAAAERRAELEAQFAQARQTPRPEV